jgi:spermidine/putrescine-binding protein
LLDDCPTTIANKREHHVSAQDRFARRPARRAAGAQAAGLPKARCRRGRLDIIAWPGYIERGESDKAYDWVTGFEKETGCKVSVKTAATSDEMVSLMTKGGYDLVTASGDASLRLIAGKRVQPINTALIPNWKTSTHACTTAPGTWSRTRCMAPLPVGPERAAVQHQRVQAAHQLERGVRTAEPA